ncbi:MAG: hypothetical protein HQL73_01805 [Magnetococcales bacterium]|nr:hypothetical protein [Magnetococcales bacterium]
MAMTMKIYGIFFFVTLYSGLAYSEELVSGRLFMVTSQVCPYCREFKETVGRFYHKTSIGKRFPLTEIDSDNPPDEFLNLLWEIRFYPTFLVYNRDGRELARFRGYRGEEAFWGELDKATRKSP